jgi:hypothetical protein
MTEAPDMGVVRQVILDALSADFGSVNIVDVRVMDRIESDDGATLQIQVVFEGKPKDLDAAEVSGAVRHVRPKLKEIGEYGFPLFSFLTKSEAGFAPA